MSGIAAGVPRYTLAEWQSITLEHVKLSPADRDLSKVLMAGGEGRLIVEERLQGLRITARSWVGVVRFEQFEVCVVPKLAGGAVGLIAMLEFSTGLDALRKHRRQRTLLTEDLGLLDLVALLFAEACERIVRGGVLCDYVEREDDLPMVRGRILAEAQLLRHHGRIDRLACRFEEHEANIIENRVLAAALSQCASRITHEGVRRRVRALRSLFQDVASADDLNVAAARASVIYHRMNEHYRDAHALAWLLLEGLGVSDLLASGRTPCFSFLIDMNTLFERFVYRLVAYWCDSREVRVQYQRRDRSIVVNALTGRPYAQVIPDLLIERRDADVLLQVPIDAKYKLYDDRRLASSDIYQSFLYAYAYGPAERELGGAAIVVYPSSAAFTSPMHLRVRNARGSTHADLFAIGVSIPATLNEVQETRPGPATERLLGVVRESLRRPNIAN